MSQLLLINPRGRKARKAKTARGKKRARKNRAHHIAGYYPNPRKRRVRRFRRNPIGGSMVRNIGTQLTDGAIGAAGALATKVVLSYVPVPESLKTGPLGALTQALAGVLVGMAVSKLKSPALGQKIADGAVTVALYEAGKGFLAGKLPGLNGYEGSFGDASLLGYNDGLGDASLLGEGGFGYVGSAPSMVFDSTQV